MTALSKLKYVLATIFFLVACILTTAFQAKVNAKYDTFMLNFTYAVLFVCAFLFGGVVTGISGVLGICLYILLKNQSAWLALLGLIVGLVFGIITKLTTYLIDNKKLDKRALYISAGAFFISLGIIFTVAKASFGYYYIEPSSEIYVRFYWPMYVLPYIIGVGFIVVAVIMNKLKENINQMLSITAFVSTSLIVMYGIVAVLCSIKNTTFAGTLAKAYNTYYASFIVSVLVGLLIAVGLYIIGVVALEIRLKIKNMLKDAE